MARNTCVQRIPVTFRQTYIGYAHVYIHTVTVINNMHGMTVRNNRKALTIVMYFMWNISRNVYGVRMLDTSCLLHTFPYMSAIRYYANIRRREPIKIVYVLVLYKQILCISRSLYVTYVYVSGINVMTRLRQASMWDVFFVFYVFRTHHYVIFGKLLS